MKALTLWEPWASLVAREHKRVETRIWSTKYRGPLAIHAAKVLPPEWLGASRHSPEFQGYVARTMPEYFGRGAKAMPLGCVLCVVNLVSIEETAVVRDGLSEQELTFGNYEDGRYAWFFEMIEVFETPIPAKGNRLLWNWERL